MREKWIVEAKKGDFNGLSAKLKVSPLAVRCLMNRGVESEQEMRSFLYGTLDDLHDPFTMKGMNEAVQEIVQAREQGRKVAIASDFDCDGIFSAYILWKGFQRIGLDSEIFTPDRVKEGYGLNRRIVDEALAGGRDFLVTCDNGIAAESEIAYAKEMGAKGINVAGVCCTSNEVAMRRGVPMAGNFLQQENVVLTGACEAIVVDVQCIFPALGPLSKCFHTKFVTTSPIAQMPDAEYIRFNAKTAGENAKAIVKMAIENFKNRKPELVHIPHMKQKATVGYSFESIIKTLDKVTNSQVDQTGTLMPLWQCVASGVIRGAVAMVGCNNPKVRPDTAHIELMKKLIAHDVIIVASGCSAQAAARAGLMDKRAKDLCGAGLKRVCELADIPPVLHMGSCVDISRMMVLVAELAKIGNVNISQLPVVGCAPEWMSEKAVSIGNYVVATGIDTYLGVEPYVSGSTEVTGLLTNGVRDWVEAAYTVEKDIDKLGDAMLARIEEKRAALGV